MSPRIVIFSNQKGGVGKTTLTRELGIYLSSLAHRVLLVGGIVSAMPSSA